MLNPTFAPPEAVLYQDLHGVVVTTARFSVGPTLYPLRGITAVRYTELPKRRGVPKLLAAIAALVFVVNAPQAPGIALALAVLFLGAAVFVAIRTKPELALRILTAGGQIDAVVTQDRARADAIVAALHQALASTR